MFPRLAVVLVVCDIVFATPLVDFQVAQPPPIPTDTLKCTEELFRHTFGNSFGLPALARVIPSTDCGEVGTWAGITLNMTVTSNGTQFDRLGIISFEGVEIWRTSTPEPSRGDGIIWTYIKDVTRYIPLFSKPGTLQLELDNILSSDLGLDGQYDVRFSISYFASSASVPPAPKSDLIIGVTNITSVPPIFSRNVIFPQNAVKAFAEIYASGNGNEEFWYFNTANEFLNDLPDGTSLPNGPFREVRLLVDGIVAGVVFPYAVFFTGAITPNAWRPISSYGALDLPTYFLDLTPFIPLLTDGNSHNISLDVLSAEQNHVINQNWFVSAVIQIIVDSTTLPTSGNITFLDAPPFANTTTAGTVSSNGDVDVSVSVNRNIHIEADILSGSGELTHVVWTQSLSYKNTQNFLNNTAIQNVIQSTNASMKSMHNGDIVLSDESHFPMEIDIVALDPSFASFTARFDHSYIRDLLPSPFILGTSINNHQLATGAILTSSSGSRTGNGNSTNAFRYTDAEGNTFNRQVTAMLNVITQDVVDGSLAQSSAAPALVLQSPNSLSDSFAARLPSHVNPIISLE